jgi:hypothetical protein
MYERINEEIKSETTDRLFDADYFRVSADALVSPPANLRRSFRPTIHRQGNTVVCGLCQRRIDSIGSQQFSDQP